MMICILQKHYFNKSYKLFIDLVSYIFTARHEGLKPIGITCERGLRKSKALTINESSSLSVIMLYFTAAIPLLRNSPLLMGSQTGDFHSMQEAAEMPTYFLDMREA
jgi:hypothetical protein